MELTTERLILREFVEEDWHTVLAYQSDPRYLEYYAWTGRTAEEVQKFIRRQVELKKQEPRIKFQLAIELRSEGKLIGSCGIRKESPEAHSADIGYELNPDFWGKGMLSKLRGQWSSLGFRSSKYTACGRIAWRITTARGACWRNSVCAWRTT